MKLITAFGSGLLFALGLGVSGMTQPHKVVAFLDITGGWDPALAFVMVGAIGVYAIAIPLIRKRGAPLFDTTLYLPTRADLTPRLIGGAALFGVGWGISGFCPGPALTSLVTATTTVLVFVSAMVAGVVAVRLLDPGAASSDPETKNPETKNPETKNPETNNSAPNNPISSDASATT